MEKTLSKHEFIMNAILKLRTEKSKGIHVVYSGLNEAFQAYFGEKARSTQDEMVKEGKIAVRGCPGGAMIYLKGEEPGLDRSKQIAKTIAKIVN